MSGRPLADPVDTVSLYDGQRHLGDVAQDDDGRFAAVDAAGQVVGTLTTAQEAREALRLVPVEHGGAGG
jgi:hypothetical protein